MSKSFAAHKAIWSNCRRCELHKGRRKVVLLRGHIPAEYLFIGEAPGHSEDVLGAPFTGPAGILLDEINSSVLPEGTKIAFTNVVACIPPHKLVRGKPSMEPPKEAINACKPRLHDIIDLTSPQRIVTVGKIADKFIDVDIVEKVEHYLQILHPASILRGDETQKEFMIKKVQAELKTFHFAT